MTDQDVIDLYRCLLGRAPENANTIAAFRHYYPTFDAGRRAILGSDEFRQYAAGVTGQAAPREPVAGPLAIALLADPARLPDAPPDDTLRAGFALQFAKLDQPRLALVIGDTQDLRLEDLAPFGVPDAAILHIASAPRPLTSRTLADGTIRIAGPWSPSALAILLAEHGQKLDALIMLGPPAEPAWMPDLAPLLAPRALVAIRDTPAVAHAPISASLAALRPGEPPLQWRGFTLHHLGAWLLPVTYAPTPQPTPAPAARPSLAIAAIVRDESACILNMLRSALPFARFLAVLDTGSADATPTLVQDFLAASGVPFAFAETHHEIFEDRFADMRNAALDMVPASIDWVLMLDGDEEMAPEDTAPLFALLAAAEHDAYALPRYNYPGADISGEVTPYPDRQVRLLRHGSGPRPRYSGAVHETVRGTTLGRPPLDGSALGAPRGGPHIHHLVRRYRNTEAEERKQEFYRAIARRHGQVTA